MPTTLRADSVSDVEGCVMVVHKGELWWANVVLVNQSPHVGVHRLDVALEPVRKVLGVIA